MNLEEVICYINEEISRLGEIKSYGLTELFLRDGKHIPGEVDKRGEITYVGPDCLEASSIYHRLTGLKEIPTPIGKFGHGKGFVKSEFQLSSFIFAHRGKLGNSKEDAVLNLQGIFPEIHGKRTIITLKDFNLDSMQVFSQEFRGYDYFLKPEQYLLKINYTIESMFLKRCFTTCE